MKILKEEPFWKLSCRGCGSELEADVTDVRQGRFDGNYLESGELRYYVECPVCGQANCLPWSKVTRKVTDGCKSR